MTGVPLVAFEGSSPDAVLVLLAQIIIGFKQSKKVVHGVVLGAPGLEVRPRLNHPGVSLTADCGAGVRLVTVPKDE